MNKSSTSGLTKPRTSSAYKLQTKMNVPIKEDEIILTPEQQERMYWARIKYDSHKWIEYHKGYYKCEFCDLIHTSTLSFETVNICKKNPNLFPTDNQTPTNSNKMTVRQLTKQLLDFNPDAKISVRLENGSSVDFTLAWGALDAEGVNKERITSVSIDVEGNKDNVESEQVLS